MAELAITETPIPGLLLISLDLRTDNRGWFKENWQREKMIELGLPDFAPVQNNMSFNDRAGATRGIHAEPWDKLVSLATGRIFGAWVDLRAGEGFGRCFTAEIGPETAIFVPRGVGNAYQTLTEQTAYSYLVNDHWKPAATESYTFVNLADETLAINFATASVVVSVPTTPTVPSTSASSDCTMLIMAAGMVGFSGAASAGTMSCGS